MIIALHLPANVHGAFVMLLAFVQVQRGRDIELVLFVPVVRKRFENRLDTHLLDEVRVTPDSFGDVQDFYLVEQQALADKRRYVSIKANEARNARLQKSLESLKKIQSENSAAARASEKVRRLRNTLEEVERTYADHTISEIELIFHIYSGRLIQNYQRGLGLFIESRDGKQLRFVTAEKSDHDAVLAMSSGQISALSLAFFLSLNKVYAGVPLILIDDPSQSLDEVNVASLTDLLRCELKSRQLIVTSTCCRRCLLSVLF